jgi:5'-nucleotidase
VARRATQIAEVRANNEHVLVLDAGDSLVGDQDPARETQGQTSVEVMNRLGYDAMALGPGDLGLGPAILRQRIREARFAVLSANAVETATGELLAKPYVVREFAGHRVAIVGLSGGPGTDEITVRDPLATAQEVVAELEGQADVVILLSHAGATTDQQIAEAVAGIAAIVSGGPAARQTAWRGEKTGTLLLHADQASPGHAGRVLGIARLVFNASGNLTDYTWQPVALGPEIADDPATTEWLRQLIKQ